MDLPPEQPRFIEESAYQVSQDAPLSEKDRALRERVRQLFRANQAYFPKTQTATELTEDGVSVKEKPLPMPELSLADLAGVYGSHDPLEGSVKFDIKDVLNPEDWEHLINETAPHELSHYTAKAEHGKAQGHNEKWESELQAMKEAYGRAMVRAADEREGVEYPNDWYTLKDMAGR